MRKINRLIQQIILQIIDWLYIPFRRFFPLQLFRYGVAGGGNMVLDWVLYFIFYNFVFCHHIFHIGPIAISAHIASFIVTFPITFMTGFWLARYISFNESKLRGRTQLIRYLMVVVGCILLNYICLKLFVEACGFYPTPSKMITTVITTIFSFCSQKFYTFKA